MPAPWTDHTEVISPEKPPIAAAAHSPAKELSRRGVTRPGGVSAGKTSRGLAKNACGVAGMRMRRKHKYVKHVAALAAQDHLLKLPESDLAAAVATRTHTITGIKPKDARLARLLKATPMGVSVGHTTGDVYDIRMRRKKDLCDRCRQHKTMELVNGLVAKLYCDSCRMVLAHGTQCPNPKKNQQCLRTLWVDALGLPSALCISCHDVASNCSL